MFDITAKFWQLISTLNAKILQIMALNYVKYV